MRSAFDYYIINLLFFSLHQTFINVTGPNNSYSFFLLYYNRYIIHVLSLSASNCQYIFHPPHPVPAEWGRGAGDVLISNSIPPSSVFLFYLPRNIVRFPPASLANNQDIPGDDPTSNSRVHMDARKKKKVFNHIIIYLTT